MTEDEKDFISNLKPEERERLIEQFEQFIKSIQFAKMTEEGLSIIL